MKIAFDAKRYFHNSTGLGNYSRWLIEGLAKTETKIILCTPKPQQTEFEQLNAKNIIERTFPSMWRTKTIIRDLKALDLSLYHGLSNEIPFGMHKSKIPAVVTIHDLIQKRFPENYSFIDRSIYNRKIAYAQKHAAAIITPSQQTKKDLIKYFGTNESKIHRISIGLNSRVNPPSLGHEGNYVLCISSFTRRKNLLRLIKAFDHHQLKDVPLIIAGKSGETLPRIQKMSSSRPNVQLRINPSSAEIEQLYSECKFCVYPSLFEGYGLPVIESYQHRKTLAVSNVSSLPEVAGEAAAFFDPRNTDEITDVIRNLWFSEKHRVFLESKIAGELEKLESSRLISQYINVYKSIL